MNQKPTLAMLVIFPLFTGLVNTLTPFMAMTERFVGQFVDGGKINHLIYWQFSVWSISFTLMFCSVFCMSVAVLLPAGRTGDETMIYSK